MTDFERKIVNGTFRPSTYQGEFPIDVAQTEFRDFTPSDWAMYFIERYGQIDGLRHKAWVLDQVARILKGTPVIVTEARWGDQAPELRVIVGPASTQYQAWLADMTREFSTDEGEIDQYAYDAGIAP